jgi:hypothetical protein
LNVSGRFWLCAGICGARKLSRDITNSAFFRPSARERLCVADMVLLNRKLLFMNCEKGS